MKEQDNRTIPEIMTDLEKACLDFQTKWQAFIDNYKATYSDSTKQEKD